MPPNYPTPPQNIIEFARRFAHGEDCATYLYSLRYPNGYVCIKCASTKAWPVKAAEGTMICENGHKISVTAGTSFHRSKQSLTTWFWAIWLVATHKSGISALQFQNQLGIENFETAFMLLHKIRSGLVAPDRTKLTSKFDDDHDDHWIEVDQIEVGGEQSRADRDNRGSNKATVMVAVEVHQWIVDNNQVRKGKAVKGDPSRHTRAGRARMRVVPNHNAYNALTFLSDNVERGSTISTDAHSSFNQAGMGYRHRKTVAERDPDPLPTLGRITTNLKRWLMGTHKGAVQPQHLQAYLNEYVFRFNRREIPWIAFNRALAMLALGRDALEYEGLYKHTFRHINPSGAGEQTDLFTA